LLFSESVLRGDRKVAASIWEKVRERREGICESRENVHPS